MAKNVSSKQGLFDDLDFVQPSGLPKRADVENQTAGPSKAEKDIWGEWKSKMTVKKSVYLTKRTAGFKACRHGENRPGFFQNCECRAGGVSCRRD